MSVDVTAAMAVSGHGAGAPAEPTLDAHEIQGNIIPGFMKPRLGLIALSLGEPKAARAWIKALVPSVTTLADVMPSRIAVRAERLQKRVSAGHTDVVRQLDDSWLNIAFSRPAIATLLAPIQRSGDTAKFADEAFQAGMAVRAGLLGDPVDETADGNPSNWLFGGPGKEADVLLVFGADRDGTLDGAMAKVRESATGAGGMTVLYEETGGKLDEIGSEQFGFQDGVSQPGVRGLLPGRPPTFMNPRTIAASANPESGMYGYPGQYLVWPGQFVFGYPAEGGDPRLAAPPQTPGPGWSINGSYLVFRRLRQDVAGFDSFLADQAEALRSQPGFDDMTAEQLGAILFGRWHSGAPLSRVPDGDDEQLGRDPLANNHFDYGTDTAPLPLVAGGHTNIYPEAKADPVGLTCPLAAHIRKVNTRDTPNDQGGRRASFNRRILRRGLPFGPRLPESGPDPVDGNRGLLFLSYQASIVDQFEFLNNAWMSDPVAPRSPSGHDMVVGQNGQPGRNRVRSCTIVRSTGQAATVTATADAVIPTGGGYFFSPSISALRNVLGGGIADPGFERIYGAPTP
jgi:Dyp-type peroxidase family